MSNLTADQWNKKHPVGTCVIYYPIMGRQENRRNTKTRSVAWNLGHGEPVVSVEGQAGGVCLSNILVHDWENEA